MIRDVTNYIFANSYLDPLTFSCQISENWTRQYFACKLKFYKEKKKALVVEYKNSHNENDFMEHF